MAENYLQHAEHYFRLVAAAQPQQNPQRSDQVGQASDGEDYDDDFTPMNDRFASPEPASRPAPQGAEQQQQQPATSAGESAEAAAAPEAPASEEAAGEGGEQRRHRERRPRRRTRASGEAGVAGNEAGNEPQPDVGLPAFLTAGNTAAE